MERDTTLDRLPGGTLLLAEPGFWAKRVWEIGFYQWFFLWMVALTPKVSARWCASRWMLLTGAALLGRGQMIALSLIG
jgi:hypothetical protein